MSKHNWSEKEDKICIAYCKKYCVLKSFSCDYLLIKLKKKLNNVSENSIRMKLQNIKYFLEMHNIKNTLDIASLAHISEQSEKMMGDIFLKNSSRNYLTIFIFLMLLFAVFLFYFFYLK